MKIEMIISIKLSKEFPKFIKKSKNKKKKIL